MPEEASRRQQLYVTNQSVNIAEALAARVKDPLWFLARQWQTGEFEAENGGKLAGMEMQSQYYPFKSATVGEKSVNLDLHQPLEALVEAEADTGDAPNWRTEALEYGFDVTTPAHTLTAEAYGGRALDWHHFEVTERSSGRATPADPRQIVPTQLHFRGAPHPRWWRMEDGDAYFDSAEDVEPNVLSMILPEFFYTDINNWYIAPAPMPSGSVRQITKLTVTDSFGVTTEIEPAYGKGWKLFAVDGTKRNDNGLSGEFLVAPNVALDIVHNDPVEDVRFIRDEQANLVWAWEHLYQDNTGSQVINGDGVLEPGNEKTAAAPGDLPEFKLSSETPPYWIPYVPRFAKRGGAPQGEVYLRRGRTIETATPDNPQFSSKIVEESVRLNEEEVPRTGLRVRRLARFARGSDGSAHFWVGRQREAGRGNNRSGLKFDFIDE